MKDIINKLWFIVDGIKNFIFSLFLKLCILAVIIVIAHNGIKITEYSDYNEEYKDFYIVYEGEMMNLYTIGEGEQTIVILPEFGSPSPAIEYKALAKELSSNYKVAIVEYFGYGYSMSSVEEERTNENIAYEIKTVLELAGISGNYILMPHETSNVYAFYFARTYPELVSGIISIEGIYPNEANDSYYASLTDNRVSSVKITSILEYTGYARILSYVHSNTFYIDKMIENTEVYSSEDISSYRNRIATTYLTSAMVKEIENLKENMLEIADYTYPDTMPVLEILASDTVNEYQEYVDSGDAEKNLVELASEPITNPEIQQIMIVPGEKMLPLSNTEELLNVLKDYLGMVSEEESVEENVTEEIEELEENIIEENIVEEN